MKSAVKDVMTTRVLWVREDASYKAMAAALRDHQVSAFPVLDEEGKVIGVISEADLLAKEAMDDRPDTDIHDEIKTNVLLNDFLVDAGGYKVTVTDGVVTLTGTPETDELGHEIVRQVRHVQGVVAVRDRLSYQERASR